MLASINNNQVVQGWLHTWDVGPEHELNISHEGRRRVPQWEPRFCVLTMDNGSITFHRTEQNSMMVDNGGASPLGEKPITHTRLDGGKGFFHTRWGYRVKKKSPELPEKPPEPSDSEDDASIATSVNSHTTREDPCESLSDSSSNDKLDDERRGSQSSHRGSIESVFSTFRIVKFFTKKGFMRSSEVTDSSRRQQSKRSGSDVSDQDTSLVAKVRNAQSHESVLTNPPSMHSIDLSAPGVEIKPLHSSVLGQGHCFHVATSQGSKYISCTTSEERDKWLSSLRRTMRPQEEHSRRSDSSLKLWILEAKNVAAKKRYFCEILLDQTLYAMTSMKTMTDMLFWGEHFEFKNLPTVETITVNLYREADKKKKKDKNVHIGFINVAMTDLENRKLVEKWITCNSLTTDKTGKENKSELPLIRLKARRQTVDILPLDSYQNFTVYLCENYKAVCTILEPLLTVREKEDIATSLVHVLQKQGRACEFLSDIVMDEISRLDDEHLTFRGNSIATKAMEAYMKLVGEKYLKDTLGDLIHQLIQSPDDCEVDPTKVATSQLLMCQQKNLDMYSNMVWVKITNSFCYFPNELREVFTCIRGRCCDKGKGDYTDNLISSCIFLRFLCPAILYPSLFNLTQEYPNERSSRNLTLIAKTIQTLANFTQFGVKEEFMTFMNAFVEREANNTKIFLQKISNQETGNQFLKFDGDIDLGKELSVLHSLLLEYTEKYSETTDKQLEDLSKILNSISSALKNPGPQQEISNRESQIYDNLLSMPTHRSAAQIPVEVTNNPGQVKSKLPLSPTDVLIDLLHYCGESTDDLPALMNRGKPSDNKHLKIKGNDSDQLSGSSSSGKKSQKLIEVRNMSTSNEDHQVHSEQARTQLTSTLENADGDYIDLIPLMTAGSRSSNIKVGDNQLDNQLLQPLAFANPLFGHQPPLPPPRKIKCGSERPEGAHSTPAIPVWAASRLSSTSSVSSEEGNISVSKLRQGQSVKSLSALDGNVTPDHYSSIAQLKRLSPLSSSSSNDSLSGQPASCTSSSSLYTYSPESEYSASTSFLSPSSSMEASTTGACFLSDCVMDGCSTFPRRHRDQQEQINSSDSSPPLVSVETLRASFQKVDSSTPVAVRGPGFHRYLSNPSHGYKPDIHALSRPFDTMKGNKQAVDSSQKQQTFPGVNVTPGFSNVNQENSFQYQNNSFPSSYSYSSHSHVASSPGFSSRANHQRFVDARSYFGNPTGFKPTSFTTSRASSATAGLTDFRQIPQEPSTSTPKGTTTIPWRIAHRVERSSSLQETCSSSDSSPQNFPRSARHSISGMNESGSSQSIISEPSSLQSAYYTPTSISNNYFSNQSKLHQRASTHSDPGGSVSALNVSSMSQIPSDSSSLNNESHNPRKLYNRNLYQTNSNLVPCNTWLSSCSDSQINTKSQQPNPLPKPPAFLISKYAIVHPHRVYPNDNSISSSTQAVPYHSTQAFNSSRSNNSHPYTTSHSSDRELGHFSKQGGEVVKVSSSESVLTSGDNLSTTSSCNMPATSDDRNQALSCTIDSADIHRQSPQFTLHAGISSIQRKLEEQEKTKQEYELEVDTLRQQLMEAHKRVQQTEMRLVDHEIDTQKLMDEWQSKLVESETLMRRQQAEKDEQMKVIMTRYWGSDSKKLTTFGMSVRRGLVV